MASSVSLLGSTQILGLGHMAPITCAGGGGGETGLLVRNVRPTLACSRYLGPVFFRVGETLGVSSIIKNVTLTG